MCNAVEINSLFGALGFVVPCPRAAKEQQVPTVPLLSRWALSDWPLGPISAFRNRKRWQHLQNAVGSAFLCDCQRRLCIFDLLWRVTTETILRSKA